MATIPRILSVLVENVVPQHDDYLQKPANNFKTEEELRWSKFDYFIYILIFLSHIQLLKTLNQILFK